MKSTRGRRYACNYSQMDMQRRKVSDLFVPQTDMQYFKHTPKIQHINPTTLKAISCFYLLKNVLLFLGVSNMSFESIQKDLVSRDQVRTS